MSVEHMLTVMGANADVTALATRVRALHPYDLPEVVALDVSGGDPGYLDWVIAESS